MSGVTRIRNVVVTLLLIACLPSSAHAGGLYLSDRGVRSMGRGGAFVAGADDPGALWYNPAGLAESGRQLLLDATLVLFDASFQRLQADGAPYQVGSEGGGYPEVEASHAPLPIPTAAYSDDFGLEDWTFGFGVLAQNQVALRWPYSVRVDGDPDYPAPQRYSLLSMDGSLLANLAAGVAWSGIDGLSIGATVQLVAGRVQTETVIGGCDGAICSFPESPHDDIYATLSLEPAWALTGSLGVTYRIVEAVRVGASFNLPYALSGVATAELDLPEGPTYREARVQGDQVDFRLEFPWVARAGVEVRPLEALRVELTYVMEGWASHDALRIEPRDVRLEGVLGVGDYEVGPITPVHDMRNTHSVRLGAEYLLAQLGLTLRAGVMLETSAFPDETVSPFTPDSDRLITAVGIGYALTDMLRVDGLLAHGFMRNRQIRNSRVTQPNGVRPQPAALPVIANGDYSMASNFIGVGLSYKPR